MCGKRVGRWRGVFEEGRRCDGYKVWLPMMTDRRVCTYGSWHPQEGGYAYILWDIGCPGLLAHARGGSGHCRLEAFLYSILIVLR